MRVDTIKKAMIAFMGFMIIAGCSRDDDNDVVYDVNAASIVGEWMVSHHNKNPKYSDTDDMWDFTFNSDGTGRGPFVTGSFRYEIDGNRIILTLMNTESYYGQIIFIYEIVNLSEDRMEWDEITHDHHEQENGFYLKFYRK